MAFNVTGLDPTTGRVLPKGTNVIIPPQSAGWGDVVLMNSNRDIRIVGWGTYNASSLPSGFVAYGVIYGFINGMAMVVALEERLLRWAMAGPSSDSGAPTSSGSSEPTVSRTTATITGGKMRNGNTHLYAGMNLNSLLQNSYSGENTILHPSAAWDVNAVMSRANFDALTISASNAKGLYGTYENYVRQTLAINGAPGTVFGFHDSGIKVHEQGKINTLQLGIYGPGSGTYASEYPGALDGNIWYPAANYCYNYKVSGAGDVAGNWWLHSMFELTELMADAHWSKVNTCGATTLSNRVIRWCSILRSGTSAWCYAASGHSDRNDLRYALRARPVTLLKLV